MSCICGHHRFSHAGNHNAGECEECDRTLVKSYGLVGSECLKFRDARPWYRRLWPITARIAIEFDSADIQATWWHPWFHSWPYGVRVGVLGLHLVIALALYES